MTLLLQSAVTTRLPVSPSFTGSRLFGSSTSMKYMSVQMRKPSPGLSSAPIIPASVMPKVSVRRAPQLRSILSRFAWETGSAEVITRFTELRSMPFASARFARCSA